MADLIGISRGFLYRRRVRVESQVPTDTLAMAIMHIVDALSMRDSSLLLLLRISQIEASTIVEGDHSVQITLFTLGVVSFRSSVLPS